MAILEDASAPAAVDSTNATWGTVVTTASFTPPSGSLLVALVAMDGSGAGTATSCTVTDSRGLTWTLLKRQNTIASAVGGTSEIWVADTGASAAMTVSVQQTAGTSATGHGTLAVKVLTGAAARASQTGAVASGGGASTFNAASITTTTAGAHVYGALLDYDAAVAMTANANSTIVHSFSDSGAGDTWTALEAAADVATPGAVSIGVTNTAFHGQIALAEILPAAASGEGLWRRGTGPRQIAGPYSRQFQYGADPSGTVDGVAALAGTATLTTSGNVTVSGSAAMSGVATLTTVGSTTVPGTAALVGAASLTTTGTTTVPGTASMAATGTLTTTGTTTVPGTAALAGTATLTTTGTVIVSGTAALSVTATLTTTSDGIATGIAALSASATLTTTGTVVIFGTVAMTASSSLRATGSLYLPAGGGGVDTDTVPTFLRRGRVVFRIL